MLTTNIDATSEYHCFTTIGGLRRPSLLALDSQPVDYGEELSGAGSTIGNEKQRPVPRLSYYASGTPPPTSQGIII